MRKYILNPISMFFIGLLLGFAARLFDIYTEHLGNIFSSMAIWILFGTLISIYSQTKEVAMLNIFLFCIGMLITYYITAVISQGVYGKSFIEGWVVFAFCSPVMAYFTRMTKEKGFFPKIISISILLVSLFSSIVVFRKSIICDFIIDGVLIYFLFVKKIERK